MIPFRRHAPLGAIGCALLLAGTVVPAGGTGIQWFSALFGPTDADSGGAPLDGSWSFYLGAFSDPSKPVGWEPGPGNTDEWHQYWVTADVAAYFPPVVPFAGRFTSLHEVTQVIPIFTQGYIWGTNRDCPNGEWILMTNPSSWLWPFADPLNFTTVDWTIDGGTETIVGAVNEGGFQMQTAAVTNSLPPLLSGENWRELHFTEDEIMNEAATVSGWNADPNRNGRSNLLEFAYRADPRAPQLVNEPAAGTMEVLGSTYLTLTVTKDPNAAITYTPQVSSTLQSWDQGPGHVILESDGKNQLVFRDLTPLGGGGPFRGMRVHVTVP